MRLYKLMCIGYINWQKNAGWYNSELLGRWVTRFMFIRKYVYSRR
jgi:hypothetical protein